MRPQTPLTFTVGAGDMSDPLIHIGISDMRVDFYAWMEERWVRLLTMAVDINVGINLTVTKDANMKPAIQPMLVGVDAKNVTIRVSNTDLLQETPAALEAVFPSLINIATGALGGVVKPIALPAVAGFSLDNLKIQRVQTSQDDFVAIYGTIVTGTPAPLIDWSNPNAPRTISSVRVNAAVAELKVPSANELQASFGERVAGIVPARPTVKLALGTLDSLGLDVEYAWRVDGGMWRPWTRDTNPTLSEDAFLLQGHHTVDVRSRIVNDWSTESEPTSLDVLIDSVPPELHPAAADNDRSRFVFGGFDIVSDAAKLQYAWGAAGAERSEWSATSSMSYDEASALTLGGARKLVLYAKDEAGNVASAAYDLGALKFASFGAIRWHTHTVDVGIGAPATGGDDVGRWTSMTMGPDGKPAIAYSAWVQKGVSGMPESQLRWAQATTTTPTSSSDWTVTVVDSRLASSNGAPPASDMGAPGADMAMAPADMAGTTPADVLLPEGVALMATAARQMDGSPGIAYYDRTRGNLRYVEWNPTTMAWNKPTVLDGED
ncbi:MAG: hypothetical protein LC659_13020, partial [Myxococcales bacterium]|nr:hypothetical protein [Myxococcales bacterium]